MNKVYRSESITYVLGCLSVVVNLLVYLYFLFPFNFQDLNALFRITLFVFIPMGLLILGFRYRNYLFMYGAFIISIPFGMYLFFLTPNMFIRIGGLLQIIYLVIAIIMTIDLSKAKKESKQL